uniref:BTB domain-containing protein n=1 Tax=Anopheles dirus TaxID=7168 RepID=A0A182N4Y9_9DIPT
MNAQQFSLRWNNYSTYITGAIDSLRYEEDLVDVTLCCEGRKLRAHKILLSACSPYFKDVFRENPCQHPVIIFKNVPYTDLKALVEFMYQGEVSVAQEQLPSFLNTAEILAVRGLTDNTLDQRLPTNTPTSAIAQQLLQAQTMHDTSGSTPTANSMYLSMPSSSTMVHQPNLTQTQSQTGHIITKPIIKTLPPEMPTLSPITPILTVPITKQEQPQQLPTATTQAQSQQPQQHQTSQTITYREVVGNVAQSLITKVKVQQIATGQGQEREQHTEGGETSGSTIKLKIPEFINVEEPTDSQKYELVSENIEEKVEEEDMEQDNPECEDLDAETGPTEDKVSVNILHATTETEEPTSDEKPHKCPDCRRTFCSMNALKRHRQCKHQALLHSYRCAQCDARFKTKWSLSTHKSKYHRVSNASGDALKQRTGPTTVTDQRARSASTDAS